MFKKPIIVNDKLYSSFKEGASSVNIRSRVISKAIKNNQRYHRPKSSPGTLIIFDYTTNPISMRSEKLVESSQIKAG